MSGYTARTPAMVTGTIETVSVEWIMKNSTGSVHTEFEVTDENGRAVVDYESLIATKAADAGFDQLWPAILQHGFIDPIVLIKDYTSDLGQDEIGRLKEERVQRLHQIDRGQDSEGVNERRLRQVDRLLAIADGSSVSTRLVHDDGHHRMAVALLLCLDEIPVLWTEGPGITQRGRYALTSQWLAERAVANARAELRAEIDELRGQLHDVRRRLGS